MNINFKQVLGVLIVIFSVLAISGTNLTDLFGPRLAKTISSAANILNAIIGGVLGVVTGQAAMVKDVAAMPGVEPIRINAQANQTLAAIAMDPTQENVSPTLKDAHQVAVTAAAQ